ncbi:hypothetical protein [Limnofasciculus baicalensis]|nr:hypothetical protein [Limnofasciculus baicalensis]
MVLHLTHLKTAAIRNTDVSPVSGKAGKASHTRHTVCNTSTELIQ